jgi:hypothetical protein
MLKKITAQDLGDVLFINRKALLYKNKINSFALIQKI